MAESNQQQIKEVRSKTQPQNLETKTIPKQVRICHTHSASFAFSWQEGKEEEIIIIIIRPVDWDRPNAASEAKFNRKVQFSDFVDKTAKKALGSLLLIDLHSPQ